MLVFCFSEFGHACTDLPRGHTLRMQRKRRGGLLQEVWPHREDQHEGHFRIRRKHVMSIVYESFKNIIYYIFKGGLRYLAMFKLFQRIIFAFLTKEFFSRLSYIVYCSG